MKLNLIAKCLVGMIASGLAATVWCTEIKVGYVSQERIFREAAPAVKAMKKLEKEFQPRDDDIKKLAKQVKDIQDSIEKDGVTMSESQRRDKEQEMGRLNRDLQRMQREVREDLNMRKNEELQVVLERTNKVIQQIAESEKFDLIVQEAVYRSPRIDITDKVIKALADKP
jgi:outer membrane protein